jgi:hypothetical protein
MIVRDASPAAVASPARSTEGDRSNPIPRRIFSRLPLSSELAEAIGAVLEAQELETDLAARALLVRQARVILETWLDGRSSDAHAARALRNAVLPRMRLVR